MSRIRIYAITCLLLAFSSARLFAQEGRQELEPGMSQHSTAEAPANISRLSKDTILIGDQVTWSIDVEKNAIGDNDALLVQDAEGKKYPVGGVEYIKGIVIDTADMKIKASAVITSFDSGSYNLPAFPVLIRRADGRIDTLEKHGPRLEVTTIPIDTASFKPFDIKGQMKYPVTFDDVYPWILAVLAVAAIAFLIWFLVRRFSGKGSGDMSVSKEPPHIIALMRLENIRKRKLWQEGKEKLYYTEITDALRAYVEGRFGLQAMESTTKEIMDGLKGRVTSEQFDEIEDLFTRADLVKFAKYKASAEENENALPAAVRFVNSTFETELENDKGGK